MIFFVLKKEINVKLMVSSAEEDIGIKNTEENNA